MPNGARAANIPGPDDLARPLPGRYSLKQVQGGRIAAATDAGRHLGLDPGSTIMTGGGNSKSCSWIPAFAATTGRGSAIILENRIKVPL
jgi:hypothetical protein